MSEVISFTDGVLVEIAGDPNRAVPVSSFGAAEIGKAFAAALEPISAIVSPIAQAVQTVQKSAERAEVTIEISVAFTAEGGIVLCKSKAEGALKISVKCDGAS